MTFETFFRNAFLYICSQASIAEPSWVEHPKQLTGFAKASAWNQELNSNAISVVIDNFCHHNKIESPNKTQYTDIVQFFWDLTKRASEQYNMEIVDLLPIFQKEICYQYSDYFFQKSDRTYMTSVEEGFLIFLREFEKQLEIPRDSLSLNLDENIMKSELNPIPFDGILSGFGWDPDINEAFEDARDIEDKMIIFAKLVANYQKSTITDRPMSILIGQGSIDTIVDKFTTMCEKFYANVDISVEHKEVVINLETMVSNSSNIN